MSLSSSLFILKGKIDPQCPFIHCSKSKALLTENISNCQKIVRLSKMKTRIKPNTKNNIQAVLCRSVTLLDPYFILNILLVPKSCSNTRSGSTTLKG
jgi:hypothetical protein